MVAPGIETAIGHAIRQAWVWGRKIGSKKWRKELKSHVNYVHAVEQKVKRYKNSMNSRCSDCRTSMPDVLTLLEGKLKESHCIRRKWKNKNSVLKRMTSRGFIKELQRSENSIRNHLQLLLPDCRCQATQRTNQTAKPATQHIDRGAISIHAESLIVTNCTLNLNQGPITIQPCSEHPQPSRIMKENYGHLMEKKNQNQLQMDKENIVHPSPMEKANQSPIEREKVHRPTRHEKVDKGDNRKSQLRMGKENDEHRPPMEKANQSAMERGKVHRPTRHEKVDKGHKSQLRMGKENNEHRPMEKANQLRMGKENNRHEKVDKVHNRKPAPGKQGKPAPGKQGIR